MPTPSDPVAGPAAGRAGAMIARFAIPLLVFAVGALFIPPLGLRDWWYPDEPDVALPVIEMAARGDWLVPTHNGQAWLDYPPLAYWGARLAGVLLGGVTPFATRLPMVLFFAVLVAVTVAIARRLGDARTALYAGLCLLAMPLLWFQAGNLQVDLGFAAAIAGGIALYLAGDRRSGASGWAWRAAGFAAFGLAMLGKGPLGLLLPGLILTLWHLWNREWRRLVQLAPLALVALAVALPWYLLLCERLGSQTVLRELYLQNLDRFGQTQRGHGGKGVLYYLTRLPVDAAPWFALLVPALVSGFRHRRDQRTWRLLAVWCLAPLLFFTLASTKRNVYLVPIYPAIALLVAGWLLGDRAGWEERWRTWAGRICAGGLVLAGAAALAAGIAWPRLPVPGPVAAETFTALRPAALVLGALLLVGGGLALHQAWRARVQAWAVIALTMVVAWSGVMWLVLPAIDRQRSYQPAAAWLDARLAPDAAVGFFVPGRESSKRPAWLCHLGGRRLVFLRQPGEVTAWLEAAPGRLVLSDEYRATLVERSAIVQRWQISSDRWVVVASQP